MTLNHILRAVSGILLSLAAFARKSTRFSSRGPDAIVAEGHRGPESRERRVRRRILYIHSTLVPPPTDRRMDRFAHLSEVLEGDVLQPVWFEKPSEVEAVFGPGSYPVYSVGSFRYHWRLSSLNRGLRERVRTFSFYVRKGLELHRERRFECIVAYSHMTTGVMGVALKLLTGARLVVEVVTSPQLNYIAERERPGVRARIMKAYSDLCLHVSMFVADRAHFLYPDQTSKYALLRNVPNSVFHDFVPVSVIRRNPNREAQERFVLMVGAPWYLKGADLLARAFAELAGEFPEVKLKLLGYYPDLDELKAVAGDCPRIEFLRARPNPEALKIVEGATAMVLPSRSEGLSRALIEGMAAGLPVIGSDIGGTPHLVRDGENGFLFSAGDSAALARRLRQLLADAELRRRMGEAGFARAHSELDEKTYVREFARMVEDAVKVEDTVKVEDPVKATKPAMYRRKAGTAARSVAG